MEPTFIKLTDLDGDPIYFNLLHIVNFGVDAETHAAVISTTNDDYIVVKEAIEDITNAIKKTKTFGSVW